MVLDTALYAERLLDWLYDKQAVLVRQRLLERQERIEQLKQYFDVSEDVWSSSDLPSSHR